ncbi:MAG: 16S rRNA (adenine(1518)-N(6)/adenine(1519)-N(6))-dimethyltransferase RsmA [Gemmataceae bacterium]|nr:16S rRNA (adenine(1518)-N(6)/adenine(1519)-N(6))-dimethyltransferase RsmA [Gemmata sp.]MDW8197644.1 16S rRNA (adenine(1518)-N(6)/adenine(1519)-N(6))-dimethyltransferase RsmA [Gemmataceae bacterium]
MADGSLPLATPRQTLSYLRRLFESHGLTTKSKLGQNFLIDLNLLDLLVRTAELDHRDAVLEVGTGTGSLTAQLAQHAGAVVTIEIDPSLQPIARQIVGERSNVRFLYGDALAKKSELNPEMLRVWDEFARTKGCLRKKLVANLPYVIATPLISNLLVACADIERMVVMVQWEIAERLRATPGTKDYNALSILVQSVADVEVIRKVLPTNFYPRPKVDSAIVLIKPNPDKRAKVGDVAKFRVFLRDLYVHRRKNLRQALCGWPRGRKDRADVDAKLAQLGIEGTIRSETLDIDQHLKLCAVFG